MVSRFSNLARDSSCAILIVCFLEALGNLLEAAEGLDVLRYAWISP